MSNINNRITLADWLITNTENNQKPEKLYDISKKLKEVHQTNHCLSGIKPNCIYVSDNRVIDFNDQIILSTNEKEFKEKNIQDLSIFFIGCYLGYDITTGLMNIDVLKNNFQSYSYLFEPQEKEYFNEVLNNDNFIYYDSFIDENTQTNSIDKNEEKPFSKSTAAGRAFAVNDNEGNTNYFIILTITAILTLFASLMAMYFLIIK